jgi:ricin-type beta-trefoil lectin protein/cellulase (glycosyl hydrolase family 5)
MKTLKMLSLFFVLVGFAPTRSFSWNGMPTPPLHVEGRFLKDPSGNNVVLRGGWMQPTETWFNGGGRWYSNPTDWTNPNNVAGMLNFLNDAATLMSDTSPRYGRNHGWYSTFVRVNTDAIGGWTQESGLVNQAQFNGWIQNFLVPYANHLRSRGLYLILSATGPINTPNNGSRNAGMTEQARLRTFWSTVANAPGVKNADNIMFELMNEPVEIESSPGNGDWGFGQAKYFLAFRNWIQPVINDIRSTGANNVIWVPTLEWQGSPQQHVQYPFTGSNCGIAVHYYPAYGGCYDNVSCHNNLWNSQYKPAADSWPIIITENFWFPEDNGLVAGSTANYGNTLRANIAKEGNVSYMIGFLSDLLDDLNNAPPANCNLSSKQGAQAAFEWFYQDNSCAPTSITPYVQVNSGSWQQTSSLIVSSGAQVRFGPQPVSGGSWNWSGCGTSGSSREQTVSPTSSCTARATYTNTCGAQSTQTFTVTVSGSATFNGVYSFVAQHSGKAIDVAGGGTSNGTNVQQWFYFASNNNERFQVTHLGSGWHRISPVIATGQALDVSGASTANGANIHIWAWGGGNNQQWRFENAGNGYWKIIARHSNKCLDVQGASTADGANVHQWDCITGAQNQAFQLR